MIRIVILDFDGIICDSKHIVRKFLIDKYGCIINKDIELLQSMHVPELRSYIKDNILNLEVINHSINALKYLKTEEYKVGIVSSNSYAIINSFMDKIRIPMDFIYAEVPFLEKSLKLGEIISSERVSCSNILYIGDEVRDIIAAKKVGIASMAVLTGMGKYKELLCERPDYLLRDLENISLVL